MSWSYIFYNLIILKRGEIIMLESGFMAGIHKISEFIRIFVGTNLLWVIFNLPIVLLTFILLTTKNFAEINGILIIMIGLSPLTFFPATTAMFGVLRQFVMKKDIPIIRNFLTYYKENYVRSMLGGVCIIVLWLIFGYYYIMLSGLNQLFMILLFIVALILFVFTLNFFAMTVHVQTGLFASLKNVLYLTISGHILTLGVGILSLFMLYISFTTFTFLIPFLAGSVIAYAAFYVFYLLITRIELDEGASVEK